MMVRPTDPSSWLFATVRTLLHRIEVLEGQKPFSFNPKAPVYFPRLPPGLHHAASKNFDFACLFHDLYYNAAAEPEILSAEGFDSQDAPLPDNIIQRSKNLSNNFIQRSKNLSVEVSDVPSPDNFIQFIEDNTQDAANNNVDARSNPQQVEYIQQTYDNNPLPDDGGGLLNQVVTVSGLVQNPRVLTSTSSVFRTKPEGFELNIHTLEVQYKTLVEQMAFAVQLIRDVSDVAAENRHAIGALEKIENQKVVKPDFEFSKLCELLRSFKFKFYAFTTGLDMESEYDSNDPDDDGLDVEYEYDPSDPDDDGYLSCLAGDND